MIKNKTELIKRLKENKESLLFETVNNHLNYQVGKKRQVGTVRSNAFTLLTDKNGDGILINSWIYFNHINVLNNLISYKNGPGIDILIIESEEV
jgi:hypothetical protein